MARGKSKTDTALIAALASGATHEEAAKLAKTSVRTVRRRMADPAFRRLVDQAQDAILERFAAGAGAKLGETLDRLGQLIHSEKELVALGACRTLAELLLRVREASSITRRLAAVESANNERFEPLEEPGEDDRDHDEPPDPGEDQEGPGGRLDDGEGDPG